MPDPLDIDLHVDVAAPPDRAYAYIADASRRPEWMPELVHVDVPAGPRHADDRFDGQARMLGHVFLGSSQVVQAVPHAAFEERVTIGARFTSRWEIVARGEVTQVRHRLRVDFPAGPFGWLERLVLKRALVRSQRRALGELQQRLRTG